MTLLDHVGAAVTRLVRAGLAPHVAATDAEVLARHVLGWDRAVYLCNRKDPVPPSFAGLYGTALDRRARREPVPLIIGCREFWGRDFEVMPDVLTPRPETELLVEETLTLVRDRPGAPVHIIDVGTGSGCLAVTLACEVPAAQVTATDISGAALTVARRNADRHGVGHRISWIQTAYLDGFAGATNVIVVNPPYIPDDHVAALPPEVREFEPRIALASGSDGLDAIRVILTTSADRLAQGGHLVMEFGIGQVQAIRSLVSDRPNLAIVRVRTDLQGIPRTVVIQRLF